MMLSVDIFKQKLSSFYFLSTAECFCSTKMTNEIPPKIGEEEQDEGALLSSVLCVYTNCCLPSICFACVLQNFWILSVPGKRSAEWSAQSTSIFGYEGKKWQENKFLEDHGSYHPKLLLSGSLTFRHVVAKFGSFFFYFSFHCLLYLTLLHFFSFHLHFSFDVLLNKCHQNFIVSSKKKGNSQR